MILLLTVLALAPPELPPEPSVSFEEPSPMLEAERLYRKGETLYEAADYAGAIAAFTEALALVQEMPEGRREVKLSLIYNIATAHEKAFNIDHDVTHLRQAVALYERYQGEARDVEDALEAGARKARVLSILKKLEVEKAAAEGVTEPPRIAEPTPSRPDDSWKRPRNIGIGLVVSGGAVLVGGATLAILGSTREPSARSQVARLEMLGVPPEHPGWAHGDAFIADERRKGVALMATGGTLAGVGIILGGVGISQLVRAQKARRTAQVTPGVSQGSLGLVVSGRF